MTTDNSTVSLEREHIPSLDASVDLTPIRVRVQSCMALTPRVNVYTLASASGRPLPPYTPGAHIRVNVTVANGRRELRSYSLIDPYSPAQPYRIAVQREDEGLGGSVYFHGNVRSGSELEILPPSNHFALVPDARHSILIAGGIGITPIFCMAGHLQSLGQSYELHYAGRSIQEMALHDDVTTNLKQHSKIYINDAQSRSGMSCQEILSSYQAGHHAYVCGPATLIQAVRELARDHGWPESAVHFELFSNSLARQADDADIEVELRQTGITVHVKAGTSILDAVMSAGVDCDYDCRAGECGACLTNVIDGVPLHRDLYLNNKERERGDSMCTCVSWARSGKLVLDL